MVRNKMRTELTSLLEAPEGSRRPAIRRSLMTEWIYATDLPALYNGTVPDNLTDGLEAAGWESEMKDGWLQLRKPAPDPPKGWYDGPFGPEAACCLSLLGRHSSCAGNPEPTQRILIKAGEEGAAAYEEACAALHREWAERLRRREPIPAVSRRYFGE